MKIRWALAGLTVLAFVLIAAVVVDRQPQRGEFCTVRVGNTHAQFDLEQGQWAALIAARSRQRGLPPRAASIALATAFQESKIHNIDYGDRDSLGLFQQRPSQGWGSSQQIMDPDYAIERFYDALVEVDQYESMDITKAAQRVQRSGHPEAYEAHEAYSRALASALTGYSAESFTCQFDPGDTGNADKVSSNIDKAFGTQTSIEDDSHVHYRVDSSDTDHVRRGWAVAQYAVANAKHLQIRRVSFDGRSWSAADSPDGWQKDSDVSRRDVVISLN